MFCSKCGAQNEDGRPVCASCGESLAVIHVPSREQKTTVAFGVVFMAALGVLAVSIIGFVFYSSLPYRHPPPDPAPGALRVLAVAMEEYYADNGTYTKDWAALSGYLSYEDLTSDYPGVRVQIVRADWECWIGRARREGAEKTFTYNSCEGGMQAPEKTE